jgi:hypothetical protein
MEHLHVFLTMPERLDKQTEQAAIFAPLWVRRQLFPFYFAASTNIHLQWNITQWPSLQRIALVTNRYQHQI